MLPHRDADPPQVLPEVPSVFLNPAFVDFGDVLSGRPASRRQAVEVKNVGPRPVTIDRVDMQGTNAADFGVTAGGSPLPFQLAPRGSLFLDLTFQSNQTGRKRARVAVLARGTIGNARQLFVTTVARVVSPYLDVTPRRIAFGTVAVGGFASRNVLVQNVGSAPLEWWLASDRAGDFSWSSSAVNSPQILQPGASELLSVRFEPSRAGDHDAALIVESDHRVLRVALSGIGAPQPQPSMSVSRDLLVLGVVPICDRATGSIIVSNNGGAPLTLTSLTITGSPWFKLNPTGLPLTIAPAQNHELEVTLHPLSYGEHDAELWITSNASNAEEMVELYGVTPRPTMLLMQTALDFGAVGPNQAPTRTLTINTINFPLEVNLRVADERLLGDGSSVDAFRITGAATQTRPGAPMVNVPIGVGGKVVAVPPSSGAPDAVAPGGSLEVEVLFLGANLQAGDYQAKIELHSSDPDAAEAIVDLSAARN